MAKSHSICAEHDMIVAGEGVLVSPEDRLRPAAQPSADADRNARLLKMAHEDLTCRNGYRHYCPNCDNSIGEHLLTEMDAALASSRSGEAPHKKGNE